LDNVWPIAVISDPSRSLSRGKFTPNTISSYEFTLIDFIKHHTQDLLDLTYLFGEVG